jgi:D-alanine--D-alanine ligase
MPKLRVGVFMGGKTIEKEVSFNSGRTVCDHLDASRYDIMPIFQSDKGNLYMLPWHFLHRGKISDFEHRLAKEAQEISWDDLKKLIDFVYIATHGRYAEDGTLQGFLEVLRIPYLGSKVFASALGMDKIVQKDFLSAHGIDVAKGIVINPQIISKFDTHASDIFNELKQKNIKPPYIVKPHKEGSSLGVSIVFKDADLHNALIKASLVYPNKPQAVLIEEKIEGMEFSSIIITDYKTGKFLPLPPTEIVPDPGTHFFDYEQKYMPGRSTKFTPPREHPDIIKAIQTTAMKTMEILGFTNIGRIDGFVTSDKRVIIVDPNSLSGMAPTSFLFREAAEIGMSHSALINHLIETELHAYGMLNN